MSFVRPDLSARLRPYGEVALALAIAFAGAWVATRGGWFLLAVGGSAAALASGWAVIAFRRTRFLARASAPGVVEIDEGQIGYFGPSFGGFVALADLTEIRLTELHGVRQWRLRTLDAQVLSIPVGASGAERLFEAFSVLPGIDMGALAQAMTARPFPGPLWHRPDRPRPPTIAAGAPSHRRKS